MLSYILRFVLLESSGIDRYSKEFIELLLNHDVAVVADVMRFTGNRFEHFRKVNPETLLLEAGTDYIDMGEELGGYRRGGYQNFTTTSQFQEVRLAFYQITFFFL